MRFTLPIVLTTGLLLVTCTVAPAAATAQHNYLGFDRNDYPGDSTLTALRKTFRYTGYWLNSPPGEQANTWKGKRTVLIKQNFGFLVLFNGRMDRDLKGKDAAALGSADGSAAVTAALGEGFSRNLLIFLDQEEGGRLLPEQITYILSWAAAVRAGGDRAGVYCSGMDVPDGTGTISTARDLRAHADAASLALWVANDACPPSHGCTQSSQGPEGSGVNDALVWQYALSPRRSQFTTGCPHNAASDGNCYAPGLPQQPSTFLDMDTAGTPDPSGGTR